VFGEAAGKLLDLRLNRERFGQVARHFDERVHQALLVVLREYAAGAAGRNRERDHGRQLTGKRFGRRHADFRSGQCRHRDVAFAGDGRGRHVDDGKYVLLVLARMAQRRQRVRGLARLRDENREIAGAKRRAELRRDVDLDRQVREALEPQALTGVIKPCRRRRSRCGPGYGNRTATAPAALPARPPYRCSWPGLPDHLGLLMHFLGHEMPMTAIVD
jgi:hypothetical protein